MNVIPLLKKWLRPGTCPLTTRLNGKSSFDDSGNNVSNIFALLRGHARLGLIRNFKPSDATPNTSSSDPVITFHMLLFSLLSPSLPPLATQNISSIPYHHYSSFLQLQPLRNRILFIKNRLRDLWPPALCNAIDGVYIGIDVCKAFPELEQSTPHCVLHPDCERSSQPGRGICHLLLAPGGLY